MYRQDLVLETIESPDYIVKAKATEMVVIKHCKMTSISSKYLVVIYNEDRDDGFIITAFMSGKNSLMGMQVCFLTLTTNNL